jgi:hypothetical protein
MATKIDKLIQQLKRKENGTVSEEKVGLTEKKRKQNGKIVSSSIPTTPLEPTLYFYTPINTYNPNPVKSPEHRDSIRKTILLVVNAARLAYYMAIIFAKSYSPFNWTPTISRMLATQPLLSPFFVALQCFYMCAMLAISLMMTSASHVTNDRQKLKFILDFEDMSPMDWTSWLIPWFFLFYFSFFLLIHVVKLTEYEIAHDYIAILGIVFATSYHLLQWRRRALNLGLHYRVHGPGGLITKYNKSDTGKQEPLSKEEQEQGEARMKLIFGFKHHKWVLWANFLSLVITVGVAITFVSLSWSVTDSESTTNTALAEYVTYDLIIALDMFRMLDVWCPDSIIALRDNCAC